MNANLFGIQINADKNLVSRQAKTQRILEIRVQSPLSEEQNNRPALNLAIVLDRSGSMSGMPLDYVIKAASHVLDQLNEHDQVSIVVYDDQVQVLAPSMHVTNGNRFELKQLVSGIQAGNMTNLGGGWLTGCKEVAKSAGDRTINRTLLLTDGLANVGETDLEVLAAHALEIYKDSISTSTFGVGEGFNEHLLEAMANRGGGNFHYIASPRQIPEIFLKEFNDLVGITARKVEIKLDLPPSVEWQVLGGWSAEYKGGHLHIYVGDMLAGKLQDIYLRLQFPADDKTGALVLNAKAFGQGKSNEVLEAKAGVEFSYADQQAVDSAAVNQGVMERYGIIELAESATEALILERKGERQAAQATMRQSINRNRPYMAPSTSRDYENLSDRMKNGLTEEDRKQSHWNNYNTKRQKKDEDKI